MKTAFVCSLLLLAGSVSCNPMQVKVSSEKLPDWLPSLPESLPEIELPDWFPNIPEVLPEKPEWWPELPSIPVIVPDWWPPTWPPQLPEWLPELPEVDWGAIEWPALPEIDWENIEWPEINLPDINLPNITINKPVPGTQVSVEQYPGIVQVEVGSGFLWSQGCAGSVLTSVHILSAARCFSGRAYSDRFRRIRAGSSTRYSDGVIIEVSNTVVHPSFGEGRSFDGDIAVVRLSSFLAFSTTIQQTPIVSAGFNLPAGLPVIHVGWGSTAQGKKVADRNLYSIDLVAVDNTACAELWSGRVPLPMFNITSNMICSARPETGGRDADHRDIGAPIYYDGILVGTVSFGSHLGNERFPVVATAVGSYTDWIVENAV